jgi:uncharacterized coiled-coil protein SlyX
MRCDNIQGCFVNVKFKNEVDEEDYNISIEHQIKNIENQMYALTQQLIVLKDKQLKEQKVEAKQPPDEKPKTMVTKFKKAELFDKPKEEVKEAPKGVTQLQQEQYKEILKQQEKMKVIVDKIEYFRKRLIYDDEIGHDFIEIGSNTVVDSKTNNTYDVVLDTECVFDGYNLF